jgi:hypothetical protein
MQYNVGYVLKNTTLVITKPNPIQDLISVQQNTLWVQETPWSRVSHHSLREKITTSFKKCTNQETDFVSHSNRLQVTATSLKSCRKDFLLTTESESRKWMKMNESRNGLCAP